MAEVHESATEPMSSIRTLMHRAAASFDNSLVRLSGRVLDWHFGISTRGYFLPEQLGNQDPDAAAYVPSSYLRAWRLLRMAHFVPNQDAFLDYGCGLGRVLALAARYPYSQVIGVEFSAALCVQAQRNVAAARRGQRCSSVSVVNADAREFRVPENVSVVYIYNAFRGETLRKVVGNIAESIRSRPRPVQLLVCNCSNLIEATGADWLMRTYFGHSGDHSLCVFRSR